LTLLPNVWLAVGNVIGRT